MARRRSYSPVFLRRTAPLRPAPLTCRRCGEKDVAGLRSTIRGIAVWAPRSHHACPAGHRWHVHWNGMDTKMLACDCRETTTSRARA
jgi:hypothetical protein